MYNYNKPLVGVYGNLPDCNIVTSVVEALEDNGFYAVYFGETLSLDNDVPQDYIVHLDPNNGLFLLEEAVERGIRGVTLNPSVWKESFSVVDIPAGVTVYGSGTNDLTTMIKGILETGDLLVDGDPSDQLVVIEQEAVANLIVSALKLMVGEYPTATFTSVVERSTLTTLGEFAKVVFRSVQQLIHEMEESNIEISIPELTVPEIADIDRSPIELPEYVDVPVNSSAVSNGVKATIYRLFNQGQVPPGDRAMKYELPAEIIQELTGERGLLGCDSYLLSTEGLFR